VARVTNHQKDIAKTQDTSHYSLSYDDVKQQFDQLNPGPINLACTQWSRAASALGTLANRLKDEAGSPLHNAWKSKSSPDAQLQLQEAQATAHALADQCMQMARATDYAYKYADWYKAHLPGDGYVQTGGDSQRAVDHLMRMLSRYNEVIATVVPSQVRSGEVASNPGQHDSGDSFKPNGPGGGGGPSAPHLGGGPGAGGGGGGGAGLPGGPDPFGSGGAGGGAGAGDPGFPGGGAGGAGDVGDPFGNGGLGSGAGGGFGGGAGSDFGNPYDAGSALAGGGAGGGLGGGLGGGAGGGIGAGGLGGVPGGGVGAGGAGAGRGGAGAGARGAGSGAGGSGAGAGRGGGMHGGQEGGEEDRERTTWLTEDDDVWGGDTDAPPPVIGS
jgi:hypothetical protein